MHTPKFSAEIGNRLAFALEFELIQETPRLWNEWRGNLVLRAGGHLIGTPQEIEMVSIGLDSLYEAACEDRKVGSQILSSCSASGALDAVMQARYGDSTQESQGSAYEHQLFSLEVLPRRSGPFFEDWEAILLNSENLEQFVFRREGGEATICVWPQDTFRNVVKEARQVFERLARRVE